jgi:hypothetical protein
MWADIAFIEARVGVDTAVAWVRAGFRASLISFTLPPLRSTRSAVSIRGNGPNADILAGLNVATLRLDALGPRLRGP